MATNGHGMLWFLDGWDELPTHLQHDSLFRKLLPPKPNEEQLKKIEEDPFYSKYVSRGRSFGFCISKITIKFVLSTIKRDYLMNIQS